MKKLNILLILTLFILLFGCGSEISTKEYTINIFEEDNTNSNTITIDKPQKINLPTPIKEGYTFEGWYPNLDFIEGTEVTSDTIIGKNINLYAKWSPIDINITLNFDGGEFKDGTSNSITIKSDKVLKLDRLYKDGFLFEGWFIDGERYLNNKVFTKDTTIDAKWTSLAELNSLYNITYELNGGSFYSSENVVNELNSSLVYMNYNDSLTEEFNFLVGDFIYDFYVFDQGEKFVLYHKYNLRDRFSERLIGNDGFLGNSKYYNKWIWLFQYLYTIVEEDKKPYFENIINNNYTLPSSEYSDFSIVIERELWAFLISFRVSYKLNDKDYFTLYYENKDLLYGYKEFINKQTYEPGNTYLLANPYKEAHTFMGWYDNSEFSGDRIYTINYNEHKDITLYAKFEKER